MRIVFINYKNQNTPNLKKTKQLCFKLYTYIIVNIFIYQIYKL